MTERKKGRGLARARLLLASAAIALTGCTMQPASDHAKQIQGVYYLTFVFAAVIFVVVGGAIVYSAIRFRQKPGDESLPKQIHGSTKIEIVWTVIPTIIVAVLFVASSITLGKIDTAAASPLQVNVTGFQWEWQFTYPAYKDKNGNALSIKGTSGLPGQGLGKPTLGLPVGHGVRFTLDSPDAIHSFYIPVFLFKRDVIPGHTNAFDLTPTRAGTFSGKCAELCGVYHSEMLFIVKIMPKDQFDQWIQDQLTIQGNRPVQCAEATNGTVDVTAKGIAFDTSCIQVAPDQPFTISFDNQDAGTPHNFAIYTDSSAAKNLVTEPPFPGVKTLTIDVKGLPAGTYFFRCDVHPGQMTGTFKVAG